MAESREVRGMRTSHRVRCCFSLLLLATAVTAMGQDQMPTLEKMPPEQGSSPTQNALGGQSAQVINVVHPDPLYDLHLQAPHDLSEASSSPSRFKSRTNLSTMKSTTSTLPRFLPDGHRHFVPDPRLLPGDTDIRVLEGSRAVLPCTVQYLGARQISWQKVGKEHLLSIGSEVWVKDGNLNVKHRLWPASVGDWNLVIEEARLQDSGVYECQVISTEKLTRKVRLSVVVIHIEGKRFVEHGQTVYLRCNTTEGDRVPDNVAWFKDGDKIDENLYPEVFITKHRSEETKSLVSELMISSGSSRDSGTYICRSSSQLIASVDVSVLVAGSPNVKRGTGTSHNQVRTPSQSDDENAAMFLPTLFRNPLIFLLTILSTLIVQQLVT